MLEKISYSLSAVLATTLVVAVLASGLHAKDVMKAAFAQMAKTTDDKRLSLDTHHHTHIHRFVIDVSGQSADQRALRKYLHLGEKDLAPMLD
jgi:sirohydrochlorin ferrochelatase